MATGLPILQAKPTMPEKQARTPIDQEPRSPAQLADLERRYQRAQADKLMEQGVRLADPARFDLRGGLQCGSDVEIDVNCVFEGSVTLGNEARIGCWRSIGHGNVVAGVGLGATRPAGCLARAAQPHDGRECEEETIHRDVESCRLRATSTPSDIGQVQRSRRGCTPRAANSRA